MGNEIKVFNNLFKPAEAPHQINNLIQNSNSLEEKSSINNISLLDEEKLFLIKGFKQHYIITLASLTNKNIILLGDSKVGKTSIFNIIFEKEHLNENEENNERKNSQNYAYFEEKIFYIDGLELNINIWDTPGEEEHKEANKHFIKDCIISYLCFHLQLIFFH